MRNRKGPYYLQTTTNPAIVKEVKNLYGVVHTS